MFVLRRFGSSRVPPEYHLKWKPSFERVYVELQKVPLSYWQFAVQFFLVLCLSFSLAQLFWLILPAPLVKSNMVNWSTSYLGRDNYLPDSQHVDIKQLKALHLFGKEEVKASPVVPVVNIQAAETHLSLLLAGVIVSNIEQMARAIIATNNQQELYPVGAPLPVGDGITLVKVLTDRVIINNNGKFESLFLDQDDAKRKLPIHAAPQVSREESQRMLEWQADHAEPEAPPAHYRPVVSLPDQAIIAMERTMSNVVSINTFKEGGKLAGFKVGPGRDAEKFKELGLQPNDVIIAINGWPMSDPAQILDMYQNLGESNSASVQIKRGSSVMTVEVALQ